VSHLQSWRRSSLLLPGLFCNCHNHPLRLLGFWCRTKAHWNDARNLGYPQALTNRKGVVTLLLEGVAESWSAQAKAWTQMVGFSTLVGVSKARVGTKMEMWSICKVQTMIKEHPLMVNLSEPNKWFSLQLHVNDSSKSRTLYCFRAANVDLRNRRPNLLGESCRRISLPAPKRAHNEIFWGKLGRSNYNDW